MTDSLASPHPVELRRRPALAPDAVARANRDLVTATPAEVVRWACHQFGRRLVLTASFADTILIDIATEADADIEDDLAALKKLYLDNNQLTTLPKELGELRRLERLYVQ